MNKNLIRSELDAIDYDHENDSLILFVKEADYKDSLNLNNIIIDFSKEGFIKGVEILNASEKFGVSKYALRNPHKIQIDLKISNEKIELKIELNLKIRNKSVPSAISIADINEFNLPPASMAMSG